MLLTDVAGFFTFRVDSFFGPSGFFGALPQMAYMSNRMAIVTLSVSVAFLIPAVLNFAQGPAAPPFQIRAVRQRLVNPPDYRSIIQDTGSRAVSASQFWLEIDTEFASSPDWADDVQLKYYVLLGRGENAHCLVGDITYINVARGDLHRSAMFVHPNTVERYGNGRVEAVAVQLLYKGQLIDQSSYPPSGDRWWERLTPVSGLVLPPRETPWSVLAFDRYESPKPTPSP
ncbi:MAG: hypothetical protein ABSA12_00395 [Verrucomicrobiia bacterium]